MSAISLVQPRGVPDVILGYSNEKTVCAGRQPLDLRVSCGYRFSLDRVELLRDMGTPIELVFGAPKHSTQWAWQWCNECNGNPRTRDLYLGSYATAEGLPPTKQLPSFSVECWVRPWNGRARESRQGVITQYDEDAKSPSCGFGLFLSKTPSTGEAPRVEFYAGDGGRSAPENWVTCTEPLWEHWYHLVSVCDSESRPGSTMVTIWLNGQKHVDRAIVEGLRAVVPGSGRLAIGAYGNCKETLDADVAMPTLWRRALTAAEIDGLYENKAGQLPSADQVYACWPINDKAGEHLADISPQRRNCTLINQGTWKVVGPGKSSDALRLASDDLYDCGWPTTIRITVPLEAAPGLYAAFIKAYKGKEGYELADEYPIEFIVRRSTTDNDARKVAILCATNTWLAYNGDTFRDEGKKIGLPAFSMYAPHAAGQPTYQVGLRVPWHSGAKCQPKNDMAEYSYLMGAELFVHRWLNAVQGEYDALTDFELAENENALQGHRVLIINGHSEYWSKEAHEAVRKFLVAGNRVIVLSGNTMFWRVALDIDRRIMECRKFGPKELVGGNVPALEGEESYATDGQSGGLMRNCGRPAWKVIGTECVGYDPLPDPRKSFGHYKMTKPGAEWVKDLRERVEKELSESSMDKPLEPRLEELRKRISTLIFGEDQDIARNGVGHEFDVSVNSVPLIEPSDDRTRGLQVLAVAKLKRKNRAPGDPGELGDVACLFDYSGTQVPTGRPFTVSEIVYWDRPDRGKVFAIGSIAVGRALDCSIGGEYYDGNLDTILRMVLRDFETN